MKRWNLLFFGANTLSVQEILDQMDERELPVDKIKLYDDFLHVGEIFEFRNEPLLVGRKEDFTCHGFDALILLSKVKNLKSLTTELVKSKVPLIDLSGSFAPSANIPIIFSEFFEIETKDLPPVSIVPSPLSIATGLICKPIADHLGVSSIFCSGIQGVSQKGSKLALDELFDQTKDILSFRDIKTNEFPKQIAFNVFPTDEIVEEESRVHTEVKYLLNQADLKLKLDVWWAGFFVGLCGTIWMNTLKKSSLQDVEEYLMSSPSLKLSRDILAPGILDAVGKDYIVVSNVRYYESGEQGLTLRFVMDNLRKGLSTNLVQLLELFS
ncbi:hypothetical protein JW979_05420 [bacterium]|nr:hypothetical protein [candidate division CSSED10-310 bacterium]